MSGTVFRVLTARAGGRHGYAVSCDVEHLSDGAVRRRATTRSATLAR